MDSESFVTMMNLDLIDKPEPVLSWPEVTEAQVAARHVEVPDAVWGVMRRVVVSLADSGIFVSPRRLRAAGGVVRASAWLDERSEATPTDLLVLKDMLWVLPEQAGPVAMVIDRELKTSISPAALLLRDLRKMRKQVVEGLPERERLALAEELGSKVLRARTEVDTLERREVTSATKACQRMIAEIESLMLHRLFRSDPAAAAG
jgi:MoxR-like ATPase